jgi:dUTPase
MHSRETPSGARLPAPSDNGSNNIQTSSESKRGISDLQGATPGSAGLDLSPASRVVLTPEMGTRAIPTGIYGPLPVGSVGLLLGRGGMTMKGLHVFPGVIDSNFQGEIKVMACTLSTIVTLTPEQNLVELILIPYLLGSDRVLTNQSGGTKGFGSSNKAYRIQQIRDSHQS